MPNAPVTAPAAPPPSRDVLLARLREDLLGPTTETELINERPTDRYLTGILSPIGEEIDASEDESLGAVGDDEDDPSDDSPAPLAGSFRPSTCGVSFALKEREQLPVAFKVSCARYRQTFVDASGEESTRTEDAKRSNERWKRNPLSASVDLVLAPKEGSQTIDLTAHGIPGLELYVRTARTSSCVIVTSALINRLGQGDDRADTEANTFFQVTLRVVPHAPTELAERPARTVVTDRDSRVASLIYRDVQEYAVGHTCSASWAPVDAPTSVSTEWIPTAVVRRTRAEGDPVFDRLRIGPDKPLEAEWLSRTGDAELNRGLGLVVDCYEQWVTAQSARIAGLSDELRPIAEENIKECQNAVARMRGAVTLLATDRHARDAWRLAAGAMHVQFGWTKKKPLLWHPFQLAFQLLVVPSLGNRGSPDRAVMDLLWFPTGGGKTEAYLALTAFVLFFRRLKYGDEAGAGTSVLMRYTLRLLTIQQFQRAAALVLACEAIRRGAERVATVPSPKLGERPFSIGLWVGGSATPNRFEEARAALEKGGKSSPRQLERCPRCRSRLNYDADLRRKAVIVTCSESSCYFSRTAEPMPLWTVDQDIYREQPGLVIATIDKFAQVVRSEKTGALFGFGTPHDAPDLVIQDELHLIAGPLGSLAGLFEVAIDRLCSREHGGKLLRPKVIGSTATIRRAEEQVRQLFDREAFQFPPPVIDARNSGFGIEDPTDPGRLYVGVTTAGRSAKFALQATYASLLQSATDARIPQGPKGANPRDAYWTLTGYFNSLRELGGTVTLVMDDVLKSIRAYARRHGEGNTPRRLAPPVELTSRVASSEIPSTLEILEQGQDTTAAVDVLLASNMISVGVDISRLGLMVVAAQPKTIAEYIQATSRVGRHYPGMVVVVYNHPRVRDRSFFETFPTWHRALYRAVEATSVTPFASRARDKAMHAIVVALARHLVGELRTSPLVTAAVRSKVLPLLAVIADRSRRVDPSEATGSQRKAQSFLDAWAQQVHEGLTDYWDERDHLKSLLIGAELAASLDENGQPYTAWPTPNSMREVEPSSLFRLWFDQSASAQPRRRRASSAEE